MPFRIVVIVAFLAISTLLAEAPRLAGVGTVARIVLAPAGVGTPATVVQQGPQRLGGRARRHERPNSRLLHRRNGGEGSGRV
jgi:hypothetical protein